MYEGHYDGNRFDWDKGVRKYVRDDLFVIEVDTDLAEYKGLKWKSMGAYGRRKWENFLFLHNQRANLKTVFCYKP